MKFKNEGNSIVHNKEFENITHVGFDYYFVESNPCIYEHGKIGVKNKHTKGRES